MAADSDNFDSGFDDERAQVIARLAILQRLRDQTVLENRPVMLHSVEQLIKMEQAALHRLNRTVEREGF